MIGYNLNGPVIQVEVIFLINETNKFSLLPWSLKLLKFYRAERKSILYKTIASIVVYT